MLLALLYCKKILFVKKDVKQRHIITKGKINAIVQTMNTHEHFDNYARKAQSNSNTIEQLMNNRFVLKQLYIKHNTEKKS